jgi:hypothetical protein
MIKMSIIVKKLQKEGIKGVDFTKKGCYPQAEVLKSVVLTIKTEIFHV